MASGKAIASVKASAFSKEVRPLSRLRPVSRLKLLPPENWARGSKGPSQDWAAGMLSQDRVAGVPSQAKASWYAC